MSFPFQRAPLDLTPLQTHLAQGTTLTKCVLRVWAFDGFWMFWVHFGAETKNKHRVFEVHRCTAYSIDRLSQSVHFVTSPNLRRGILVSLQSLVQTAKARSQQQNTSRCEDWRSDQNERPAWPCKSYSVVLVPSSGWCDSQEMREVSPPLQVFLDPATLIPYFSWHPVGHWFQEKATKLVNP